MKTMWNHSLGLVFVCCCALSSLTATLHAQAEHPGKLPAKPLPAANRSFRADTDAAVAMDIRFHSLKLPDWLPSQFVNCIGQDSLGFMWFGTQDGLVRYDGRDFRLFQTIEGDSASLISNDIRALFADSRGRFWVAAGGLNLYDARSNSFKRYHIKNDNPPAGHLQLVTDICEDRYGNLWFATFNHGLFRLSPETHELVRIGTPSEGNAHYGANLIYNIAYDRADTLWVSSGDNRITAVSITSLEQQSFDLPDKANIHQVFIDASRKLWLTLDGKSINRVVGNQGHLRVLQTYSYPLVNSFFFGFTQDFHGRIWVAATAEGIVILHPGSGVMQHLIHETGNPAGLPGNEVQGMFRDRDDNIWIATERGIARWVRWEKPFRHYAYDTADPGSIGPGEVTGISPDRHGMVWLSLRNGGFCRLDPATGLFKGFDPSTCAVKSSWALEIYAAENDRIWLAANLQHGIVRYDPIRDEAVEFRNDPQDSSSISFNLATTFYEDRSGRLWIGTSRGLNRYLPEKEAFRRIRFRSGEAESSGDNRILSIYQQGDTSLWVGTGNGLKRLDPAGGRFAALQPEIVPEMAENELEIYHIAPDNAGGLWLASNRGLYRLNETADTMVFAARPDLGDARIFAVFPDVAGNLWLQSTTAVSRYNPQEQSLRVFTGKDGWRQRTQYVYEWLHAAGKLDSGELLFGGRQGLTRFAPADIEENPAFPPLYITGMHLQYQPLEYNRFPQGKRSAGNPILTQPVMLTPQLELKHSENTFSFTYAALDYGAENAIQYRYLLEGLNEGWVNNGNERTATFTNVSPGEYVFRVQSSNSEGVWSDREARVAITVRAPWWRTGWAFVLYALLFAGLLTAAWRISVNRINLRNQLRMREFEAHKLQEVDQLKTRFFANISHELRTPLTLILGPLKDVVQKLPDVRSRTEMQVAHKNAGRLLRLINQLLDLSKLEAGGMPLMVSRGGFIALLRGVVKSFSSLAEEKQISLHLQYDPAIEELLDEQFYFDRDKIEQILINLLSNAFKFTPEGGRIAVEVGIGKAEDGNRKMIADCPDTLPLSGFSHPDTASPIGTDRSNRLPVAGFVYLNVRDTGMGIPADRLPFIFDRFYQVDSAHTREHEGTGIGLALTRELVQRHYGHISAESSEGEGTTFALQLPLGAQVFGAEEISSVAALPEQDISDRLPPDILPDQPGPRQLLPAGPNATIVLVVDDYSDIRQHIRSRLEGDYHIMEAENGVEGLRIARESVPDLIISDIMMPQMDGFQLCEQLKTDPKTSHIPVILLTAKAGDESKFAGLETGADDYLVKPFQPKELQLRVRNLIELRRKLRERFRREGLLQPEKLEVTSVEEAFLLSLKAVLDANLTEEDFGIAVLCDELGMSERQLQRKIRGLTGQKPSELIRDARLDRAKVLLEGHGGNVSEIAYAVGFNNPSYFARCFRERFGVAPSDFVRMA